MDKNILDKIGIDDYFLTGSRALDNPDLDYKISSDSSDYDYVVDIYFRDRIFQYLSDNKMKSEISCYNGGFKFFYDNKQYNIITCINIEYMAWRESLQILKELIKKDESYRNSLKNKMVRYVIYEQLRGLVKSVITYSIKD